MFIIYTASKVFSPKYIRNSYKSIKKRADVTIEKLTKDMNELFTKEVFQIVIKHVRKYFLSHHVNSN